MSELSENIRSGSRLGTVWGIAVMILGMFCIAVPFLPGLGVVLLVGIALIAAGVAQVMYAFQFNSFGEGVLRFVFSLLAVLAGVTLLGNPGAGLLTITLFLAVWFFVDGLYALFAGLRWKPNAGWGWMVFSGAISIILGVMIYRRFPESAVWLVGVLVGIRLFFAGWTMIAMGAVGRAVADQMGEEAVADVAPHPKDDLG